MRYYRVNYRKLRCREFLRLCHPHLIMGAVMWLPMKLGLVRWPAPIVPRPETVAHLLVEECDIPEPARTAILPSVAGAVSLGFEDPLYEMTQSRGKAVTGVCARCRHRDRRYIVQGLYSFADSRHAAEQHVVSFFADGSTLATSNGRPKYDRHPAAEAYYYPGRSLADLLDAHQQVLSERQDPPVSVGSRDELIRLVDAISDRCFEFMVSRGIFEEVAEPVSGV